jgi:hypothetical protein
LQLLALSKKKLWIFAHLCVFTLDEDTKHSNISVLYFLDKKLFKQSYTFSSGCSWDPQKYCNIFLDPEVRPCMKKMAGKKWEAGVL